MITQLKKLARKLKKELGALYLVSRKKDLPWYVKIYVLVIVGYALSPIDLIPDFIPVLGYLDDFILIPLGIALAIKIIPSHILEECRWKAEGKFERERPVSWLAGSMIIVIWVFIAWVMIRGIG